MYSSYSLTLSDRCLCAGATSLMWHVHCCVTEGCLRGYLSLYYEVIVLYYWIISRFRYECEGRTAGSILGKASTNEHKTFPSIKVESPSHTIMTVICLNYFTVMLWLVSNFILTNRCSIRCFWRLLCTREEVVIFDVVMATWCYGLFSVLFSSSRVLQEDVVLLSSVSHTPTCLLEKPELWNGISPPQSYHNIPSKSNSSNFWFTTCHHVYVGSHF